ncbi:MAG: DUF3300 domain-containing protein [Hyphomicrobiaceae bacterium]|nr:DUF3300 domain-containing protein [Hyphomicrobiaceae bacterium]
MISRVAYRGVRIGAIACVAIWAAGFLVAVQSVLPAPVRAEAQANNSTLLSKEQLDQMLAPIALYPDDLLSNVFMASTYPLEVVEAARWRKSNPKLKGNDLTKALESKDWDPSVKSLTQFPEVLQSMSDKLDWTQKLGDAFLAQPDDVMTEVQFLRKKADEAGSLKSNKQQKVTKTTTDNKEYIIIEPASPQVVYVPAYNPTVVYGSWWYPSYPPYYWNYGYPASSFVSGFFWGAGFAVANNLWGWGHCDWYHHNIDINVNRYNNINVNRPQITSNTWKHDPSHRGPVPYRNPQTREQYGKLNDQRREARDQFRGRDGSVDREKVKERMDSVDRDKIKDKAQSIDRDKVKDKAQSIDRDKVKDKAQSVDRDKIKDKAKDVDRGKAAEKMKNVDKSKAKERVSSSGKAKQAASKKGSSALNVKPAHTVKKQSSRGNASLRSAASHPRPAGGGGHRAGGGRPGGGHIGGGHRGGGGRRR